MAITYTGGQIQINSGKDSGTATAATSTTLTCSSKAWTSNEFADYSIWITGGTGVGQSNVVASNTTNQLTLKNTWGVTPSTNSTFVIMYRIADVVAAVPSYAAWLNGSSTSRFVNISVSVRLMSGGALGLQRDTLCFTTSQKFVLSDAGSYFQAGKPISSVFPDNGSDGCSLIGTSPSFGYWEIKWAGKTRLYASTIDIKRLALDSSNSFSRINCPPLGNVSTGVYMYDCNIYGTSLQPQSVDIYKNVKCYPHPTTYGEDTAFGLYGSAVMSNCVGPLSPRADGNYTINGGDVIDHVSTASGTYEMFLYNFFNAGYDGFHPGAGVVYFWNTKISNAWTSVARWYNEFEETPDGTIYRGYLVGLSVVNTSLQPVQGAVIGVIDKNNQGGILTAKLSNKVASRSVSIQTNASGTYTGIVGSGEGLPVPYGAYTCNPANEYLSIETLYAPFTFKVRKYGYLFQQKAANWNKRSAEDITLLTNNFVAVLEAVASSYTGFIANNTSKTIVVSEAHSVQQMYDYLQWWSASDVTRDEALSTSNGLIMELASGWKLTADSYLTWDKTVSGGTVKFSAAGTYTPNLGSSVIEFAGAGTYSLSGAAISGTVELVNTSGSAVTVSLPAGTNYTNSGPNITVSQPSLTTTISANVSLVGAEVRVYDLDNLPTGSFGTELAGVESCPTSNFSFEAASGNEVWIQILKDGYEELGQVLVTPYASTTFTFQLKLETNL